MKKFAQVAVLAALMTGGVAVQAKETPASAAVKSLVGVSAPEMAATVVKVVQATPNANRPAVVAAMVRKVAKTNPAVTRSVVSAISKADPSMAAVAAASASSVIPGSVGDFVVAACGAAPEKAAEIVALCSKVTVASQAALAETVAKVNPALNAVTLTRDAGAVRVTVTGSASQATGGFVFYTPPIGGLNIGFQMDGTEISGDPTKVTSEDAHDTDRDPNYAKAGS